MRKKIHLGLMLSLLTVSSAYAMDIIPSDSNQYYELGGGGDVSMPPVSTTEDIDLHGDANANLGYVCTGFNPSISMRNSLNDLTGSLQDMQASVINSATSALGSMPMYILSKTNKDLYNLIENAMTDAGDTFHLSMKSCQQALNEIHDGKSPYQDWFGVSDSEGWMERAREAAAHGGKSDVDINDVNKNMTKDPNKAGIPWVHKKNSGGTGDTQVPIKVIYDVVVAGYNSQISPDNDLDNNEAIAPPGTALARYFPVADDAGQWAKLILGEMTISAKDQQKGKDNTARGTGLMTIIQTCPDDGTSKPDMRDSQTCLKTIIPAMKKIVQSNSAPTSEQLKSISSSTLIASPKLIDAIRNMNSEGQALAIGKWSQDVAIQNITDKARTLRQLLIAGEHTKPVANLKPAVDATDRAIKLINIEIDSIMKQYQTRTALMTNTAKVIMSHELTSETNAISQVNKTQRPDEMNGAVYKNDNS